MCSEHSCPAHRLVSRRPLKVKTVGPRTDDEVDKAWREHVGEALAVLHTAREPDEAMAAVGDVALWRTMVEAAIAQRVD